MDKIKSPKKVFVLSNGKEMNEKTATEMGINVSVADNGEIYIEAKEKTVSFVKVMFNRPFSKDALVYGDAFERGYGNLAWKKDRRDILRWYFIANDNGEFFAGGVKTQPNSLCSWKIYDDKIELICDLRCGTDEIAFAEKLCVAQVVFDSGTGNLHDFCHNFCKKMCDTPRSCNRPVFGANDWYCNYGNSSAEKILRAAKFTVKCANGLPYKPFVVVDDGWQKNHFDGFNGGEWDGANCYFVDMKKLASDISDIGAIPGLWFRPLQSKINLPTECFTDKSDYRLDPSHPNVLQTVADDIKRFYEWGYRLVKYDFVTDDVFRKWGFEMPDDYFAGERHFFDKTKTTAQIIKNFYRTIRNAAPDDMFLLGCNAIGHLAAGFIDMQRTGDDTSGEDFARTSKMGVNTLAFRMMQHGAFFDADADCVGITEKIPLKLNAQWLDVLSKSSTPLFVSVAEICETEKAAELIATSFKNSVECRTPSLPVDWFDTLTPCKWKSEAGEDTYKWN